jgi:enterochelin esterase family protein
VTVLRVADVDGTWTAVRLVTELWKREPLRPLVRTGESWEIALPELLVDRLEYQLEVERADGSVERVCDPGAPTVAQPFGDKSVLVLGGYRAPTWVDADAPAGTLEPLSVPSERPGGPTEGLLWTAPGVAAGEPAPLLVALDGPEYVRFAGLDRFLAAAVAAGTLPPLRAALLAPRARNEDYSASDEFAEALARELLPAIEARAPVPGPHARIGLGASLGGLAMLHAHRRMPELFGALVLQSGSFFDERLDGQESGYRKFDRITAFVREVVSSSAQTPIPIALTCGTGEENLANNRAMARALAQQGYAVTFSEVRDGHTWVCFRDGLEPAFATIGQGAMHALGRA